MEKPLRQEKQVVVSVKSLPGCFPAVSLAARALRLSPEQLRIGAGRLDVRVD